MKVKVTTVENYTPSKVIAAYPCLREHGFDIWNGYIEIDTLDEVQALVEDVGCPVIIHKTTVGWIFEIYDCCRE